MASGNTKGKYNQALCRIAIPLRSIVTGEGGCGISIEAMEKGVTMKWRVSHT
jgi:hypothetical protein